MHILYHVLIFIITYIRHTDPCVKVVLWVAVTGVVTVRVLALAVLLLLDPREIFPHLLDVIQVPHFLKVQVRIQCHSTVTIGPICQLVTVTAVLHVHIEPQQYLLCL